MSLLRKSFSSFVALSLVFSLVPSHALAEAIDESGGDHQDQSVLVETQPEETTAPLEDSSSSEEQVGENQQVQPEENDAQEPGEIPFPAGDEDVEDVDLPEGGSDPADDQTADGDDVTSDQEESEEPEKPEDDADEEQDKEEEEEDKEKLEAEAEKKAVPTLSAVAHVQNIGWQKPKGFGELVGTSGRSLRVEALRLSLEGESIPSGSIEYQAHVQNVGWQGWVRDGQTAGTSGRSLRIEALKVRLTGDLAKEYDVYYQVHAQNVGWMGLAKNGEASGTSGRSYRLEGVRVWLVRKGEAKPKASSDTSKAFMGIIGLQGQAHVQNVGWMSPVGGGSVMGTTGRSLRVEGVRLSIVGLDVSGGISYRSHVQNVGWQGWVRDGALSGTQGRSLRVEAFEAKLTGDIADEYDLYYRAHVQNVGWLAWAKNGEAAGSTGLAYRVEALQIQMVPKGSAAPANDSGYSATCLSPSYVQYAALVHGSSWQSYVKNGSTAGTTGKSLRLEGIRVRVASDGYGLGGSISYRIKPISGSWSGWASNGSDLTSAKGVETVEIKLSGGLASAYDVYYRAHVSGVGWRDWAKNGASAGSLGTTRTIEAIQIRLVSKGGSAPGPTAYPLGTVVKTGWQNPSNYPQVSSVSVVLPSYASGYHTYVTPSRISINASREQCVEAFIARAYEYLGTPFREPWSRAPGQGVDCSGLVLQCLYATGMDLEHARGTEQVGGYNPYNHYWVPAQTYNSMRWYENGTFKPVSIGSMRRGDLVFYTGHVAIYLGGGKIIHSTSANVPHSGVVISDVNIWPVIGVQRPFV